MECRFAGSENGAGKPRKFIPAVSIKPALLENPSGAPSASFRILIEGWERKDISDFYL
jgi:hypothetical protein